MIPRREPVQRRAGADEGLGVGTPDPQYETLRNPADKFHMDVLAIALRGVNQAESNFTRAVTQLSASASETSDTIVLSDAAVALLSTRNQLSANIELL
jgi:hypothetical protein